MECLQKEYFKNTDQLNSVVIIEDNVVERHYLNGLCSELGVEVIVSFDNALEAIEYILKNNKNIDLVLTDICMSPNDGMVLFERMASLEMAIPTIIISGLDNEILRSTCLAGIEGGNSIIGYIKKPVNRVNLLKAFSGVRTPRPKKLHPPALALTFHEIHRAIAEDKFIPYFQPIISISTGRIHSLEVLSRCVMENGKLLTPENYIGVMEEEDLIFAHDKMIYSKAFKQFVTMGWKETNTSLSINVSPAWLLSVKGGDQKIETLCREEGLDAQDITLEITETFEPKDIGLLIKSTVRNRIAGFKVVLDDYGTGASGLRKIDKLPITGLKIDRTIITDAKSDKTRTELIKSTISMAKKLGLTVTAEGIESQEDLDLINALGCDYAQGYYICRPVILNQILKMWDFGKLLSKTVNNPA